MIFFIHGPPTKWEADCDCTVVPQILTLYQKGQESHGPLEAMRKGQGLLESPLLTQKLLPLPWTKKHLYWPKFSFWKYRNAKEMSSSSAYYVTTTTTTTVTHSFFFFPRALRKITSGSISVRKRPYIHFLVSVRENLRWSWLGPKLQL